MNLDDLFSGMPTDPAPGGGGRQHRSMEESLALLAAPIFESLLIGKPMSLADCAAKLGHKSGNAVGTILGRGTPAGTGAALWRAKSGGIRIVQENVARIAKFCSAAEIEAILKKLNMDEAAFRKVITSMPRAV